MQRRVEYHSIAEKTLGIEMGPVGVATGPTIGGGLGVEAGFGAGDV